VSQGFPRRAVNPHTPQAAPPRRSKAARVCALVDGGSRAAGVRGLLRGRRRRHQRPGYASSSGERGAVSGSAPTMAPSANNHPTLRCRTRCRSIRGNARGAPRQRAGLGGPGVPTVLPSPVHSEPGTVTPAGRAPDDEFWRNTAKRAPGRSAGGGHPKRAEHGRPRPHVGLSAGMRGSADD
jgi:hypothetical protein